MDLPPFLLDRWIEQKHYANPRIEYDLASSTGPVWTLRELLALSGEAELEGLLDTPVSYTTAAGSPELRAAIAGLQGVDASEVQVVTGASEALLVLFPPIPLWRLPSELKCGIMCSAPEINSVWISMKSPGSWIAKPASCSSIRPITRRALF